MVKRKMLRNWRSNWSRSSVVRPTNMTAPSGSFDAADGPDHVLLGGGNVEPFLLAQRVVGTDQRAEHGRLSSLVVAVKWSSLSLALSTSTKLDSCSQ